MSNSNKNKLKKRKKLIFKSNAKCNLSVNIIFIFIVYGKPNYVINLFYLQGIRVCISKKKKKKKGIRVCIYILSYVGNGTLNKNFVGATGY